MTGVSITSSPDAGDTYGLGEKILVTVAFSEAMDVDTTGGVPRLKIRMQTSWAERWWEELWADYESGTGTTALIFAYTVVEPNTSQKGVAVLEDALEVNGGKIRTTAAQTDAYLWYAKLDHDPNHKVDWRR